MAVTDIAEILARVHACGDDLQPREDGKLSYRGPLLDEELRSLIRHHKAELMLALNAQARGGTLHPCLVAGCEFLGYLVELGQGSTTSLCAPHRRELFRRAREVAEAGDEEASTLIGTRPCRFCGKQVAPEDDLQAMRGPAFSRGPVRDANGGTGYV